MDMKARTELGNFGIDAGIDCHLRASNVEVHGVHSHGEPKVKQFIVVIGFILDFFPLCRKQ